MQRPERGRHVDITSPRGYYIDFSTHADSRGPAGRPGLGRSGRGAHRPTSCPLATARYGLGNLELYLGSGSPARRDRFEDAAKSLIDEIEIVPATFGGWAAHSAPPAYKDLLPQGSFSGGTQGECISVLARAASLLGVPRAIETARTAVGAFSTPVADGGLLREVGDEGEEGGLASLAFIEEYPLEDRPVLDLSGHVRAIWGIYDYARVANDGAAETIFDRCVRGLEFELDRFDLGYWTRSNLDARRSVQVSTVRAIREQILQMEVMHDLTGRPAFQAAARRWRGYASDWRLRTRIRLRELGSRASRARAVCP